MVLQRASDDQGVHPPFDGAALLLALDDETAALARALYAKPGPDPRTLDGAQLDYEVTRLLLELEDDQLRERSDYNEAAQGEAERAGDRDAIDRLMLERRQINEARRSLDRRRRHESPAARRATGGKPMPADPLDKQLVEAVLSRPRRAKADLEEAKLAGLRPSRPAGSRSPMTTTTMMMTTISISAPR